MKFHLLLMMLNAEGMKMYHYLQSSYLKYIFYRLKHF
jgi:hypothetical protein